MSSPLHTTEHLGQHDDTPQAGTGEKKSPMPPEPTQKTEDIAAHAKRLLHEIVDEDPLSPAISGSLFTDKWPET